RVHLGLVYLLPAHGDGALVEALDAGGATEVLELCRHVARRLAIFGLQPRDVGLRQQRRRAAKGEDEVGRDALLDERFARLVDRVQDVQQAPGVARSDVEGDFRVLETGDGV